MTLFIAEISSNHHRDLERCLRFIDTASRIGCDGVKFQLFRVERLFAPEILRASSQHRQRKQWELPEEFLPALAQRCRELGLQFGCTPFHLEAVELLREHVDFYKVASYELLWEELIAACARTGKPLVLSTGMANLEEVGRAVEVARRAGCRFLTLLHCVSGYPTPPRECNLAALQTLRQLGCPVGWSDHSVSPAVIYRAVHTWKASLVEFHLDLDATGEEYQRGHCWLPRQIQQVIETVRTGEKADGHGEKVPAPCELADRAWRADPGDGLRPLLETRASWEAGR